MVNSLGQNFKDALFMADTTVKYTADEWRTIFDLLSTTGRRDDNSLQVTQHAGTPDLTVDVSPGAAAVGSGAVDPAGLYANGLYAVRLMSPIAGLGPVATPPTAAGSKRIDVVYLHIADATVVGSGNDEPTVAIQTGGATTGNPVKPAIPASSLELAYINVGTNVTSLLNANIVRNPLYARSPASDGQIAAANARSPRQGFFWGSLTGYGPWYIPTGGWTTAAGAGRSVSAIAGHAYFINSEFSLGVAAGAPANINVRCCLAINTGVIGEVYAQVDPGNEIRPTEITRIWKCTATGNYSVYTKFAASAANKIYVRNPYSSPFTEFTDLGPMS
jgi:hypothetical protein